MSKVSLIFPSRNEPLLKRTVDDVFLKAKGEIEVIVILDGPTSFPIPVKRQNLVIINKNKPEGLRSSVNDAAKIATGKYIMKSDAHVAFCPGFDEILQKDIEDNWISIPRRFDLDPDSWNPKPDTQVDYYYLGFPYERPHFILADIPWPTRTKERADISVDDTMTFGGTVWFTTLGYFNRLGGLDSEKYGTFLLEQRELGLKTWLGGGRVVVNKNAWYAHYGEPYTKRPYRHDTEDELQISVAISRYWCENKWKERVHNFTWLIDKFWPLPTKYNRRKSERHSWPATWRDYFATKTESMHDYLTELAIKYGTDRHPLSKHSYTPYYYDLFKDKRKSIKKVLEIGVAEHAGLKMWRDFFPNASIFGAENQPNRIYDEESIKVIQCDQSSRKDLENLIKQTGGDIDFVVDDGSHNPQDQVLTCLTLMPHLPKDVVYVIEDVIDLDSVQRGLQGYSFHVPLLGPRKRMFNKAGQPYINRLVVVRNKKGEKTSIIVPSRNETLEVSPGVTVLQKTVQDIYEKATGNFEVIVGFDGPPYQDFPDYPNLKVVRFPQLVGIKTMINALAAMSTGKYIYKTDAHCSFGLGFDEILQADMQDDWIVTPRFYVLNGHTWQWQDNRFYDYFFLCCPFTDLKGFRFKAGGHWSERTKEKLDVLIDETPQIHGSGWFINKDYYFNALGGFPNIDPYGHAQEPIWLALKNWLAGGKVMVNKKTWYAHLHQDATRRGYHMDRRQTAASYDIAATYWAGNRWAERKHDFDWFVKKFMPMPTWPDNWQELYSQWLKLNKK